MKVTVCIGPSCHLKGSAQIVELFRKNLKDYHLEESVSLAGNFCLGRCNRIGVTVQVDGEIFVGITPENFSEFFSEHILCQTDHAE